MIIKQPVNQAQPFVEERGIFYMAASDAHGPLMRTAVMDETAKILEKRYGSGCSFLLLKENPARILADKGVLWEAPIAYE